jgi:hypothetical protein
MRVHRLRHLDGATAARFDVGLDLHGVQLPCDLGIRSRPKGRFECAARL